jgi:GntR family transcriptional regulator, transcriptional repressor for pyruvate dehydrogenase complex
LLTAMAASGSQLLSRVVAERLEDYVLRRGYQPGDKLPSEREFGDLFGVSRTVLREAVKLLNQKGLVQSSVGRGLYVAEPNGRTLASSIDTLLQLKQGRVDHILEVRATLEDLSARAAAERASDEDLVAMRVALDEMDRLLDRPVLFIRSDLTFHLALARATHNPLLLALVEPTMTLMQHIRERMVDLPDAATGAQKGHRRIYAAVLNHDPASAAAAMAEHLAHVTNVLATNIPGWRDLLVRADYTDRETDA